MEKRIFEIMRTMQFPRERRSSVKAHTDDKKAGFVLGRVIKYDEGYRLSSMTKRHPELAVLLNAWIRKRRPGFVYSSIQVNCGGSALHCDKMNCGMSVVKAFGKFDGGELWTLSSPARKQDASCCRGVLIDGNVPHVTFPFTGERFSVVYFNMKPVCRPMPPEEYRSYRRLGFPLITQRKMAHTPLQHNRLPEAAGILRAMGMKSSHIGDYSNKTIKSDKGFTAAGRKKCRERRLRSSRVVAARWPFGLQTL